MEHLSGKQDRKAYNMTILLSICFQSQEHHGIIFRERLDDGTSKTLPFSFSEGFLIYIVGCRGMGERGGT